MQTMHHLWMAKKSARWSAGILLAATLFSVCGADRALAYTYTGSRTPVAGCPYISCALSPGNGFIGLTFKAPMTTDTLGIEILPETPIARGGVVLDRIELMLVRGDGGLGLTAIRYYKRSGRNFSIMYPVTDRLQTGYDSSGSVSLDLAVYMSANQAWIESRDGSTALARVHTIPLFFGYGSNEGSVYVCIDLDHDCTGVTRQNAGGRSRRKMAAGDVYEFAYYTVEPGALLTQIDTNYAKRNWTYPLLFAGDQGNAAAQLAALESGAVE